MYRWKKITAALPTVHCLPMTVLPHSAKEGYAILNRQDNLIFKEKIYHNRVCKRFRYAIYRQEEYHYREPACVLG